MVKGFVCSDLLHCRRVSSGPAPSSSPVFVVCADVVLHHLVEIYWSCKRLERAALKSKISDTTTDHHVPAVNTLDGVMCDVILHASEPRDIAATSGQGFSFPEVVTHLCWYVIDF